MKRLTRRRRGAAIVEFAIMLPLLLLLVVGLWEVGRLIQVQQILSGAAREGARLAAQAKIVNSSGAYTEIQKSSGTPNVDNAVKTYLTASGITNLNGLSIGFTFLDGVANREPYQGNKGERFQVTVTLPYQNVRWSL